MILQGAPGENQALVPVPNTFYLGFENRDYLIGTKGQDLTLQLLRILALQPHHTFDINKIRLSFKFTLKAP